MKIYHRRIQGGTFAAGGSGSWVALLPASAPTAAVKTIAGVTVQTLTSALDAVAARYYISTTDALYTTGTLYVPTWSVNIAGTTYTTTGYFQHVTAGTSGPGSRTWCRKTRRHPCLHPCCRGYPWQRCR